jgi:hypothetical protein
MNERQKRLSSNTMSSAIDAFLIKTAPAPLPGEPAKTVVTTPPQLADSKQKTENLIITPPLAQEWLDTRKKDNCRHSEGKIRRYSKVMAAGGWMLTHQGIAFDPEGKLHDGYHRLHSIVKANIPVEMAVTWNVDPESYKVIDVGFTRTPGHMFRMAGSTHPDTEAAAVRLMLRYRIALDKGNMPGDSLTTDELTTYWEDHDEVSEIADVILSKGPKWNQFIRPAVGLTLALLATDRRHPINLVKEFLQSVGLGANLGDGSPILHLRNKLTSVKSKKGGTRLMAEDYLVMVIRSYNAWVQKRQLKIIYGINVNGENSFPDVLRYTPSQHRHPTEAA